MFPELIIQPCGISQTLNVCVGVLTYIYPFKVPKCSQKRTYIECMGYAVLGIQTPP